MCDTLGECSVVCETDTYRLYELGYSKDCISKDYFYSGYSAPNDGISKDYSVKYLLLDGFPRVRAVLLFNTTLCTEIFAPLDKALS